MQGADAEFGGAAQGGVLGGAALGGGEVGEGGLPDGVVGVAGERAVGVVAGERVQAGHQGAQRGGGEGGVDVGAGEVERHGAGGGVEFGRRGGAVLGPAGLVPAVADQGAAAEGGGERGDPVQRLGERGAVGEVEAGEREAGGGGVHVGVDEGGGDQGAVQFDDLVDGVGVRLGGSVAADPGDVLPSTSMAVAKGSAGL